MYFRSKRDWWFSGMTAVIVLLAGGVNVWRFDWFSVLFAGGTAAFMVWIWMNTGYFLLEDGLLVRSGPLRWKIPYSKITALAKTRNPLKAPALSLDRLEIHYGKWDSLLISPEAEEEFIRLLRERCPDLTIREDRWHGR